MTKVPTRDEDVVFIEGCAGGISVPPVDGLRRASDLRPYSWWYGLRVDALDRPRFGFWHYRRIVIADRAMRRLSSTFTVFYKRVFPVIWLLIPRLAVWACKPDPIATGLIGRTDALRQARR